jgi:kynurenine formamidase
VKLIDLSQPIFAGCPNCPADPPVESRLICDPKKDGWRVEQLTLTAHTGSHIDAPSHKITDGPHVDALPLNSFVGKAVIADLRDCRPDMPFTSTWLSRKLMTGSITRLTFHPMAPSGSPSRIFAAWALMHIRSVASANRRTAGRTRLFSAPESGSWRT